VADAGAREEVRKNFVLADKDSLQPRDVFNSRNVIEVVRLSVTLLSERSRHRTTTMRCVIRRAS
jgi:hypothetical protein